MLSCQDYGTGMMACRRCHDFGDDGSLYDQLLNHIDRIPAEHKCTQAIYRERLLICDQCVNLVNGMCGYCGCFVMVRAIRSLKSCPDPMGDKWCKNDEAQTARVQS